MIKQDYVRLSTDYVIYGVSVIVLQPATEKSLISRV